jgi:hypothetical protein
MQLNHAARSSRSRRSCSRDCGRRFLDRTERGEGEAGQQDHGPDRGARTGAFAKYQQSQGRGSKRLGQVQSAHRGSRQPSQAAGEYR